jgi:sulfur-oxidizing protein SoxX
MWNEFVWTPQLAVDRLRHPARSISGQDGHKTGGTMRLTLAAAVLLLASVSLSTTAFAQTADVREPGLVPYIVKDYAIEQPLTGKPGDAAKGRQWAITGGQGNCVICHKLPIAEVAFRIGNVGPDLTEVGGRLTPGEIRMRIVNPKLLNEETIMPAYYRVSGFTRVAPNFANKPMLTPEQVEDLVAYLSSLK